MDELPALLGDIKKLLIFALQKNGASQAEIARALGVNQSSISRQFTGSGKKPNKKSRKP
jgi:predicted XRE-type DNA-binding protein